MSSWYQWTSPVRNLAWVTAHPVASMLLGHYPCASTYCEQNPVEKPAEPKPPERATEQVGAQALSPRPPWVCPRCDALRRRDRSAWRHCTRH